MPTSKLYQLRLTSRMKKKRHVLTDDKKVVTDRKSFWHEMLSRLGLLVTVIAPRRKSDLPHRKRVLLETNISVKTNECASNFYTDLMLHYWYANVYAAIVAFIFGRIYTNYVLVNYSVTSFALFIVKSAFIIILMLLTVASIYAIEEKYNIVHNTQTEKKGNIQTSKKGTKKSNRHWLTKYDTLEVLQRMPLWLSDPEMETANWFNTLVTSLWPLLQHHLSRKVDEIVGRERILDKFIPVNNITKFKISKAELGRKVPIIAGIHVMMFGVQREMIIVDADIIYDSDIDFRISGAFQFLIGLTNLYFRTKLRIIIGPLFQDKPTISSIGVTFLNTPTMNWKFIGLLRCLNANFIKRLVEKVLSAYFKNPRRVSINIAEYIPKRERNIGEPQGLLCVDIIEAKDLPRSQSKLCCRAKADAFCTVTVGDDTKYTPVSPFNDNPEWNRSFNFVYYHRRHQRHGGDIEVFVKDENFDTDLIIGGVVIPVKQIIAELNGREFSIQIRDPVTGALIYNHLGNPSLLAIKISYFDLSANMEKLQTWNRLTRNMPVASLSVLIDYATGLETASYQIQSPDIRPMVRVNVGNQFQVTSVKERSGAPLWDESLQFLLFNPKLEMIHIEVIDVCGLIEDSNRDLIVGRPRFGKLQGNLKNLLSSLAKKGTVLGYVTLPVVEVLEAPKMKTEGFYKLEGLLENASIKVLMAIRITEYSKEVTENYSKVRTMFPEELESVEDQQKQKQSIKKKI